MLSFLGDRGSFDGDSDERSACLRAELICCSVMGVGGVRVAFADLEPAQDGYGHEHGGIDFQMLAV